MYAENNLYNLYKTTTVAQLWGYRDGNVIPPNDDNKMRKISARLTKLQIQKLKVGNIMFKNVSF